MRTKVLIHTLLLFGLLLGGTVLAQQEGEGDSKLAFGLNLGLQKPFVDIAGYVPVRDGELYHHTAFAPAGEVMAKLLINNRFNLSLALGYGIVGDGFFDTSSYETNILNVDLKANINLMDPGKVNPYLFIGLGMINYEYAATIDYSKDYAANNPETGDLLGNRYFNGSFILGGGLEMMTSPHFAINLFADYRHTTSDELDGGSFQGTSKDGYFNGRVGFTYYLGERPMRAAPTAEELLAEMEQGEADLTDEGELAMFEARLDELDTDEAEYTMENYVRLKSRMDELNRLIDGTENELEELRTNLDFKNQRISDLEAELQRRTSGFGTDNFTLSYESALRNFHARTYENTIQIMGELKERFPSHKLASNCQYWMGEAFFGMRNYQAAAEAFHAVFNYDFSYKFDDATLMLGRCYHKMNNLDRARSFFQQVLEQYPDSEYVEKARQWLGRIG